MDFRPKDCFIEFRGRDDQHREDDVIISDQDVDTMRAYIEMVLSWNLDLPLRNEGFVIRLGVWDSVRGVLKKNPLNVVVTTGNGPKFVVNPDHFDPPRTLPKVTGDDQRGESRLVTLRDRLVDRLDHFIDWKKSRVQLGPILGTPHPYSLDADHERHKRPLPYPLLTIPNNDSPTFGSHGENSRAVFWNVFGAELAKVIGSRERLGTVLKASGVHPILSDGYVDFVQAVYRVDTSTSPSTAGCG